MHSNKYTLIFTSIITISLGFVLSYAATSLKPRQDINVEIDMKKNILTALGIKPQKSEKWSIEEVQEVYEKSINGIVLNTKGEKTEKDPKNIDAEKDEKYFPIYLHKLNGKTNGYVIPISGKGLWSTIYGYFAIDTDCKTAKGITFYKHGETPGLGAEIEKTWFQSQFAGKKLYANGKPTNFRVLKPGSSLDDTSVDGISGSTMTSKGVEALIQKDAATYADYFNAIRGG
mgnify:CR=1 FL=1